MKKLLSLLLIISMISTGAIATFAETVNEDVVISDVAEDIEINEEEVSEEEAEEDVAVDVVDEDVEEDFAVDVANEDVEATEVVEDVVEVDEEKSEVEEVTEDETEGDADLEDEEIGEIVLVPMKEDSSNNETAEVEEDETEAAEEEELLGAAQNEQFISELRLASAKKEKDAKKELTNAGFNVYFRDLNQDGGGNYIYLGYKTTTDRAKAIKNIVVMNGKKSPNSFNCKMNGKTQKYKVVTDKNGKKVDVNEKAGGEYTYIYYTTDESAGKPIVELVSFFENTKHNVFYRNEHPERKTINEYRNEMFHGEDGIEFALLVRNNRILNGIVANLNDGVKKTKYYKKIFPYTSKSFIGLGFKRAGTPVTQYIVLPEKTN